MTGPAGRTTVRLAVFPARAKSGLWKSANHWVTSSGFEFVNMMPTWPWICYSVFREMVRNEDSWTHLCKFVDPIEVFFLWGQSKGLCHDLSFGEKYPCSPDSVPSIQAGPKPWGAYPFHSCRTVDRCEFRMFPTSNNQQYFHFLEVSCNYFAKASAPTQ